MCLDLNLKKIGKTLLMGITVIALGAGGLAATAWMSKWTFFESTDPQVMGVLVNAVLTTLLMFLYWRMSEDTATQAEHQKSQTRLMELQSKPVLEFSRKDTDGDEVIYEIENTGPGIALDVDMEVENHDTGQSKLFLADSTEEYPDSSPSVFRPGDLKTVKIEMRVPMENGEYENVSKLLNERDGDEYPIVQFGPHAKFGTGRKVTDDRWTRGLNSEMGSIEETFRDEFRLNPT